MSWTAAPEIEVDRVREQTDESLRSERLKTDQLLKTARARAEGTAQRMGTAPTDRAAGGEGALRDYPEVERALERERHAEDDAVREERSRVDQVLHELWQLRKAQAVAIAQERTRTDWLLKEERERADLLLSRHEVPFALLVEQVRDYAIFMLDPEGKVISWNLGAERLNGYRPLEILGTGHSVFFLEEDVNAGKPSEELRIAAQEGHFEEEGWRVRQDGTTYVANVVVTSMIEDGNLVGFAVITRNVTERFSAEVAFRRSAETLRLAAEASGLGTWDLDVATGVLVLSDRCKTIMGIAPDEPVTMSRLRIAVHPDDRGRTEEAFRRALDGCGPAKFDIECRIQRPGGSVGWVFAMGRVLFVGAGPEKTPRRFIGTVLDITSRKELQ